MDQARGKPPTPAQNSTTRPVAANPPAPLVHPSSEGVFKAAPSLKGGVRTNNPTHISINNQTTCTRKGSNSAAIGTLGVAVFRRQMQQVGCLVLLFHLGELFHQCPGVLRRHFPILLPFDARQFSRRHQGKTWFFNLRNVISMWPLPPSDVLKTIGSWSAWTQLSERSQ